MNFFEQAFSRTQILFGKEKMRRLAAARVAIFGLGGVGGYVLEALARSGVGNFDLIDNDTICISNLNRQILATAATIGKDKVQVAKERVLSINPSANVTCCKTFFLPQNAADFDFSKYDYIIDAVDTVSAKIQIVLQAKAAAAKVISCMGTGNKMNPALLEVADIFQTSVCPLARVMRRELKKRGVTELKVVFSTEPPLPHCEEACMKEDGGVVGSTAFVPAAAGLLIASEVARELVIQN